MSAAICFAGLVFAFSAVLLRNFSWRGAPVFAALCSVVILSLVPSYFKDVIGIFKLYEGAAESASAILKIIGIGYLFGVSSDVCRELGEGGIASALTLVGRLEIVAVALPFIAELIELALELL